MVKMLPRASQVLAHQEYHGEGLSAAIERSVYLESLEKIRSETSLRVDSSTRTPVVANDSPEVHIDYAQ